jgi:hypothetical protein
MDHRVLGGFRETVERNHSLRRELHLARLEKEEALRLLSDQAKVQESRVQLLSEEVLKLKMDNEDLQSRV